MITRNMIGNTVDIIRADKVTVGSTVVHEADQFGKWGFKGFVTQVEMVGDDIIMSGWKVGKGISFETTTSKGNAVMVTVEDES